MSRIDARSVRVEPADGPAFDLPCVWIPRSGDKVLALWRIGAAPAGTRILADGDTWVVAALRPNDAVTEAATLEPDRGR